VHWDSLVLWQSAKCQLAEWQSAKFVILVQRTWVFLGWIAEFTNGPNKLEHYITLGRKGLLKTTTPAYWFNVWAMKERSVVNKESPRAGIYNTSFPFNLSKGWIMLVLLYSGLERLIQYKSTNTQLISSICKFWRKKLWIQPQVSNIVLVGLLDMKHAKWWIYIGRIVVRLIDIWQAVVASIACLRNWAN
jgi:hypothetical protein